MNDVSNTIKHTQQSMDKAIEHLNNELAKLRAGKANPAMLDSIYVEYYGSNVPLSQVANVNTPDARTIVIQPWEKSMLQPIEKAIINGNLGFNPQNDGNVIRINIPPLTEERRKQLVKLSKAEGEHAKVSIRTARKDANDNLKKLVKEGLPEDEGKRAEERVQEITNQYTERVDKVLDEKEKEIMTV